MLPVLQLDQSLLPGFLEDNCTSSFLYKSPSQADSSSSDLITFANKRHHPHLDSGFILLFHEVLPQFPLWGKAGDDAEPETLSDELDLKADFEVHKNNNNNNKISDVKKLNKYEDCVGERHLTLKVLTLWFSGLFLCLLNPWCYVDLMSHQLRFH